MCRICSNEYSRENQKNNYKSKVAPVDFIEGEAWINIVDMDGYSVSSLGRVKRNGKGLIKPETTNRGYQRCIFSINNKATKISLHRLVAIAFIPNPQNKPQVNHKDGDKLNNSVSNLEWVTVRENIDHSLNNKFQGKNTKRSSNVNI